MIGITLVAGALSACSEAPGPGASRTEAGDTLIVRFGSGEEAPPTSVAEVEVLWRDDTLEEPRSLALLEGDPRTILVVGDERQVHFVGVDGGWITTVGRLGDGPGEFRSIREVAVSEGRVAVLDGRTRRITVLDSAGALVGTSPMPPAAGLVNPRRNWGGMALLGDRVVYAAESNVSLRAPMGVGLVSQPIPDDGTTPAEERAALEPEVIEEWEGRSWREFGEVLGSPNTFQREVYLALGEDGRYAVGRAGDDCFVTSRLDGSGSDRPTRVCRDLERIPTTAAVRSPDVTSFERDYGLTASQVDNLRLTLRELSTDEYWPAYDGLRIGADGRIWVRIVTEDRARAHPMVQSWVPALRPDAYTWEIFSFEGDLEERVRLPAAFDLRTAGAGTAYGFLTLPTGEVTIGVARW